MGSNISYVTSHLESQAFSTVLHLRQQARQEGLVESAWWEAVFTDLMRKVGLANDKIPDAYNAILKASKATCLVEVDRGCLMRKNYHERRAKKFADEGNQKRAKEEEELARNYDCGRQGTGLLIKPKCKGESWLVITNNHVVMSGEEAEGAKVYFGYTEDGLDYRNVCRQFPVQGILTTSLKTLNYLESLDYSLLIIKAENADDEAFLKEHAVGFDETGAVQAVADKQILAQCRSLEKPLVMFSHPLGLAMRMSIGKFPAFSEHPVGHIRHLLPSLSGSSGGNLIFSPLGDHDFLDWNTGFLHFGWVSIKDSITGDVAVFNCAVGWQSIGDHLRKELANSPIQN